MTSSKLKTKNGYRIRLPWVNNGLLGFESWLKIHRLDKAIPPELTIEIYQILWEAVENSEVVEE